MIRRPTTSRANAIGTAIAVVLGLVGLVYFYRGFLLGSPRMLQGDVGDGLLSLSISRHWPLLNHPDLGWNQIGSFYPAPNTLGYADTFLLDGSGELPLKWLGVSSFLWFQLVLVTVTAVGYGASVVFFRVGPRAPWLITIPAALILTYGGGIHVASVHPQLLSIHLLPVIALLLLFSVRSRSRWKRWVLALICGLLLGLLLYSAFYIGWFTFLALGMGALLMTALIMVGEGKAGQPIWSRLSPFVRTGSALLVGFAVTVPLFLYTYLPVLKAAGGRPLHEIRHFALTPAELFGIPDGALLWRSILGSSLGGVPTGEPYMAPTLVLLVTAGFAAGWATVRIRRLSSWGQLGLASVVIGFVLWLSPVKVGRFFPWLDSFHLVPGGSALRAIGRIELMAGFALILGTALILTEFWVDRRWNEKPRSMIGIAAAAALAIIVMEQISVAPLQRLPISFLTQLAAVPAPPSQCKSFVVITAAGSLDPGFLVGSSATFIAQEVGIPTWNGYSGSIPKGWRLRDVQAADYRRAALQWGRDNNLLATGCGLDLYTRTWTDPAQLTAWLRS